MGQETTRYHGCPILTKTLQNSDDVSISQILATLEVLKMDWTVAL